MPNRLPFRAAVVGMCALAVGAVACSSEGDKGPWQLVWSDEFDGTSLDMSKWSHQLGDAFGTNQLDYDTDRTENVSVSDGLLHITALKEEYRGNTYTSGRITTADKFHRTYGRFEARIKLPIGYGMWPAFWMIGSNFEDVYWPECGEIDIMEYRGSDPSVCIGSLHGPGYSGGDALSKSTRLTSGQRFSDDFHVFAVEWEEGVVRFYRDDVNYETRESGELNRDQRWVFDHDFNLILNLAIGGNFGPAPNADTVFPQSMLVDYVRVYAR